MTELKLHSSNTSHFDHTSILIPVDLCRYIQVNHLVNPFELWLYFKLRYSGNFHFTKENREQICNDLIITDRTLRRRFKRLLEMDWIGYSEAKGVIWIRSMSHICGKIGNCRRRSAVFRLPIELDKINKKGKYSWHTQVIGFVGAAILCNKEIKKERRMEVHPKKSRTLPPSNPPSFTNKRDIPERTLLRLRHSAFECDYIKVIDYQPETQDLFPLNASELRYLNETHEWGIIRKHKESGLYYTRKPDEIKPYLITFKKRRSFLDKTVGTLRSH